MAERLRYATPAAFRSAVESRLRARSRQRGSRPFPELRREFIYQRFLARVFGDDDAQLWVLKGGVGLLARLPGARYSRDIDLLHLAADPDAAEVELREIGRRSMGDHLRFEVTRSVALSVADALRVKMTAYLGVSDWDRFDVDVSLERHFVAQLERVAPVPVLDIEGVPPLPPFQCYPITDQVADKVAAMYELHGDAGAPSNRYRDLVDLVLIVDARPLDAALLSRALRARQEHARNRVVLPSALRAPGQGWEAGYRAEARRSSLDPSLHGLDAALAQAGQCLNPILTADIVAGSWNPSSHRWEHTDHR